MNFNKNLIDKFENLVMLSNEFDLDFKNIYEIPSDKIDNSNCKTIYSLTKNYILMRKIHGELLLMMNKLLNLNELDFDKNLNKNTKIIKKNKDEKVSDNNIKSLYDISTFNSLLNNANELINNIDFEYKKIALKYPKFINKKPINIILITKNINDKYTQIILKLKTDYPENIYKIINWENNEDKVKYAEELKDLNIKIKHDTLPLIYIINNSNVIEIPLNKFNDIEQIKNLIK